MKYEKKFFAAAREGDVALIKEALAAGFPVDHYSEYSVVRLSAKPCRTVLRWATTNGQAEVLQVLLGRLSEY